jgi:hypothetical protein
MLIYALDYVQKNISLPVIVGNRGQSILKSSGDGELQLKLMGF